MRTIHCTQKLLQEIKQPVTDLKDVIPDNSGLGNWYCNMFRFNRRKFLIFTNEQTLDDILQACMQLNKMPMSAIKYRHPVRALKDLTAERF
ncbi:MAG TPA: hypothetical protein PLY21_08410 [Spirochaetota bacterium]|nr:hypothetical protein [Spirochaetota bacterium]